MFIDAVSDKGQRSDKISNTTMRDHLQVKLFFIGSLISKLIIKVKDWYAVNALNCEFTKMCD